MQQHLSWCCGVWEWKLKIFRPISIWILEWIFHSSRNLKLVFFNKREEDILWYDQLQSLAEKSDRFVQKNHCGFINISRALIFVDLMTIIVLRIRKFMNNDHSVQCRCIIRNWTLMNTSFMDQLNKEIHENWYSMDIDETTMSWKLSLILVKFSSNALFRLVLWISSAD